MLQGAFLAFLMGLILGAQPQGAQMKTFLPGPTRSRSHHVATCQTPVPRKVKLAEDDMFQDRWVNGLLGAKIFGLGFDPMLLL